MLVDPLEAELPLGRSNVSSSQERLHLPFQLRQPLLILIREKVLDLHDLASLTEQFEVNRHEDLGLTLLRSGSNHSSQASGDFHWLTEIARNPVIQCGPREEYGDTQYATERSSRYTAANASGQWEAFSQVGRSLACSGLFVAYFRERF